MDTSGSRWRRLNAVYRRVLHVYSAFDIDTCVCRGGLCRLLLPPPIEASHSRWHSHRTRWWAPVAIGVFTRVRYARQCSRFESVGSDDSDRNRSTTVRASTRCWLRYSTRLHGYVSGCENRSAPLSRGSVAAFSSRPIGSLQTVHEVTESTTTAASAFRRSSPAVLGSQPRAAATASVSPVRGTS